MKHVDVPEARRMFAAELRRMARQGHGREFAELSTPAGARIVRLVSDQHPDWRAALDQLDRPVNTSADWSVDELRASTTPSREQRERDAAAQYGFSEDAVRADPLRRDMCQTAALFAERDQARADVEREVGRIADELHVDSRTHAGRCLIFAELARRRHPLATSRRFEPI